MEFSLEKYLSPFLPQLHHRKKKPITLWKFFSFFLPRYIWIALIFIIWFILEYLKFHSVNEYPFNHGLFFLNGKCTCMQLWPLELSLYFAKRKTILMCAPLVILVWPINAACTTCMLLSRENNRILPYLCRWKLRPGGCYQDLTFPTWSGNIYIPSTNNLHSIVHIGRVALSYTQAPQH
jgi:hypothetical protein